MTDVKFSSIKHLIFLWYITHWNNKKLQDSFTMLSNRLFIQAIDEWRWCGILSKWHKNTHAPKTHIHSHTYCIIHIATHSLKYHRDQHYLSQVKTDSDAVAGSLTTTFSQYQYWDSSLASQCNSTFCSFPSDTASAWNVSIWCRRQRQTPRNKRSPAHDKCRQ